MKFLLLLSLLFAVVLSAPHHKHGRHSKPTTEAPTKDALSTDTPATAIEPAVEQPAAPGAPAIEPVVGATFEAEPVADYSPVVTDASETPATATDATEPTTPVSETPAAVTEAAETPAPTPSEDPQTPAETTETPTEAPTAAPVAADETTGKTAVAPVEPAAKGEPTADDADTSSSSSGSEESSPKSPTPTDTSSSSDSSEDPALPGEPLKEVKLPTESVQEPVKATLMRSGATATMDNVTVRFTLQAKWMVDGEHRRGYLVKIINGSKKAVCGVTFINDTEVTDTWNLEVADDGSLTTKHLNMLPGTSVIRFGYVSSLRSKPTVLAVTYC